MNSEIDFRKGTQSEKTESLKKALRQLGKKKTSKSHAQQPISVYEDDSTQPLSPILSYLRRDHTGKSEASERLSRASDITLPLAPFFQQDDDTSEIPLLPDLTPSQIDSSAILIPQDPTGTGIPSLQPSPGQQPTLRRVADSISSLRIEKDDLRNPTLRSLRSRHSTLRLPVTGNPISPVTHIDRQSSISKQTVRKAQGSRDLRSNVDVGALPTVSDTGSVITSTTVGTFASVLSVIHFQSFCVLDTNIPGCPVTATTDDLRYNMTIGQQFKLDIESTKSSSIDLVTGRGISGDEITYLVMFSPLISVGTESTRFVLASLVDVTDFLQDAAIEPELDSRPPTPLSWTSMTEPNIQLSPDDLLGGCSIAEDQDNMETILDRLYDSKHLPEDIWLSIAAEEQSKKPKTTTSPPPTPHLLDSILSTFLTNLQTLYSHIFILSLNALSDQNFEISHISPSISSSNQHLTGHMTLTSKQTLHDFTVSLAGQKRFRSVIRWGDEGVRMQCYCVPLGGGKDADCGRRRRSVWLCVLVGMDMPVLW